MVRWRHGGAAPNKGGGPCTHALPLFRRNHPTSMPESPTFATTLCRPSKQWTGMSACQCWSTGSPASALPPVPGKPKRRVARARSRPRRFGNERRRSLAGMPVSTSGNRCPAPRSPIEGRCLCAGHVDEGAARSGWPGDGFLPDVGPAGVGDLEGFCSASFLINRSTGRAVSSTTFDSHDAMDRNRERATELRNTRTRELGADIIDVGEFELTLAHLRVPEMA